MHLGKDAMKASLFCFMYLLLLPTSSAEQANGPMVSGDVFVGATQFVVQPGTQLSIVNASFWAGKFNASLLEHVITMPQILLSALGVDSTAPGTSVTMQHVYIQLGSCDQLQRLQMAVCGFGPSAALEVLPGYIFVHSLAGPLFMASDVNVTAPGCPTYWTPFTSSNSTVSSNSTDSSNSTGSAGNTSLPLLMPCINRAVSSWADVRQALHVLQPRASALRLVFTTNVTVESPCASCLAAAGVDPSRCEPTYNRSCTCSEDGMPDQLWLYRDITLAADTSVPTPVLLDTNLKEGVLRLDTSRNATLTIQGLTVYKLTVGPVTSFPRSAYCKYLWFVSFERCLPTEPPLRLINSTIAYTSTDTKYLSHWWDLAASPYPEDQASVAWMNTMECGSLGGQRKTVKIVRKLDAGGNAWRIFQRTAPGLAIINTTIAAAPWLGLPDYPAILPAMEISLDPWLPLSQAVYVHDAKSLLQAMQAPRYADIVLVANISVPRDMLPAAGIDVPQAMQLHGWPGRPTVLDMQGATNVFILRQRILLHNLVTVNMGNLPDDCANYTMPWLHFSLMWTFQFDRLQQSLIEARSSVLVIPEVEYNISRAFFAVATDLAYSKVEVNTSTMMKFTVVVHQGGFSGYDITLTKIPVAFPILPINATFPPWMPTYPPSPAAVRAASSEEDQGRSRTLVVGLAVGLTLGGVLVVVITATAMHASRLRRGQSSRSLGSLKGVPWLSVWAGRAAGSESPDIEARMQQQQGNPGTLKRHTHTRTSSAVTPERAASAAPSSILAAPAPAAAGATLLNSFGEPSMRSNSSRSSGSLDLDSDPNDPFLAPCDSHSLLIYQAGMSRDLQEALAVDGRDGHNGLAQQLHSMVVRMQEELGTEEVELERVIGKGASGVVYQGRWRGMCVACKTLTLSRTTELPISRKQHSAMNEVAVCRSLQHNNIVAAFGYHLIPLAPILSSASNAFAAPAAAPSPTQGRQPSPRSSIDLKQLDYRLVLIQEFCDGGTLRDAIDDRQLFMKASSLSSLWGEKKSEPQVNTAAVVQLATDIAAGMSHIHSRNIIHSDLSPANILLKTCDYAPSKYIAKVADFGLALKLKGSQGHISNMQRGTWHYIAPEVFNMARMSKAADVYSFGVVLHEMWHGTPAWRKGAQGEEEGPDVPDAQGKLPACGYGTVGALQISPTCHGVISQLIISCTRVHPKERPTFFTIVERLMELQRQLALDVSPDLVNAFCLPLPPAPAPAASSRSPSGAGSSRSPSAQPARATLEFESVEEVGTERAGVADEQQQQQQQPVPEQQLRCSVPVNEELLSTGSSADGADGGISTSTSAPHASHATAHCSLQSAPKSAPNNTVTDATASATSASGTPHTAVDPEILRSVRAKQLQLVGVTTGVVRSGVNEEVLVARMKRAEDDLVRSLTASWDRQAVRQGHTSFRAALRVRHEQQQQQQPWHQSQKLCDPSCAAVMGTGSDRTNHMASGTCQ